MNRDLELLADEIHEKLGSVSMGVNRTDFDYCRTLAPDVARVRELKKERNALILAHTYVHPDLLVSVADFTGDSLALAQRGAAAQEDVLVVAAVRFMAETVKLLNPSKRVFLPNLNGGCSLAESITAAEVRELRKQYPEHAFVCYINTTVDVKAECDVCVTSGNVYKIVENLPQKKIVFLPDRLMGQNLIEHFAKTGVEKEIVVAGGRCHVHAGFNLDQLHYWRAKHKDLRVMAHPECQPEVVREADFVGSTAGMLTELRKAGPGRFLMLTECGLVSRHQSELPQSGQNFVGACSMCEYMKGNELTRLKQALELLPATLEVTIDPVAETRARACVQKMFTLEKQSPARVAPLAPAMGCD